MRTPPAPPRRVERRVVHRAATALAIALVAALGGGCADRGDETSSAPQPQTGETGGESGQDPSASPTPEQSAGDSVLSDFCVTAGLIAFMRTGEDLNLWAEGMRQVARPDDLDGDALAGMEIMIGFAEDADPATPAEDLTAPPELSAGQERQLGAFRDYLERCPQVTEPPAS